MQNIIITNKLLLGVVCLGAGLGALNLSAQTDGAAHLRATILDYNGSSTKHWTVVWVTTASGTFIKTLWKQGPTITASHWSSHCGQWYAAKAGSTALDGYSVATAQNYTGTNSPIILAWNCHDANNNLMADGDYKFWIQYAEDNGQGPYTTGGLLWSKGPTGATNTYSNQGANFANMQVAWNPAVPPVQAPTITSAPPPANGIVGVPYHFACAATGTAPVGFTASGLPDGLSMSSAGVIDGIPNVAGTFIGTITATNGTLPNATQPFSILVSVVPASLHAAVIGENTLLLSGSGPTNGIFTVMAATNLGLAPSLWMPVLTNSFDSSGNFGFTNVLDPGSLENYYQLRVP
jgi:hypothetical protein